jgi:hypothetical protein
VPSNNKRPTLRPPSSDRRTERQRWQKRTATRQFQHNGPTTEVTPTRRRHHKLFRQERACIKLQHRNSIELQPSNSKTRPRTRASPLSCHPSVHSPRRPWPGVGGETPFCANSLKDCWWAVLGTALRLRRDPALVLLLWLNSVV